MPKSPQVVVLFLGAGVVPISDFVVVQYQKTLTDSMLIHLKPTTGAAALSLYWLVWFIFRTQLQMKETD